MDSIEKLVATIQLINAVGYWWSKKHQGLSAWGCNLYGNYIVTQDDMKGLTFDTLERIHNECLSLGYVSTPPSLLGTATDMLARSITSTFEGGDNTDTYTMELELIRECLVHFGCPAEWATIHYVCGKSDSVTVISERALQSIAQSNPKRKRTSPYMYEMMET